MLCRTKPCLAQLQGVWFPRDHHRCGRFCNNLLQMAVQHLEEWAPFSHFYKVTLSADSQANAGGCGDSNEQDSLCPQTAHCQGGRTWQQMVTEQWWGVHTVPGGPRGGAPNPGRESSWGRTSKLMPGGHMGFN